MEICLQWSKQFGPRLIPSTETPINEWTPLEESFYEMLWQPDIMIWNLENFEMRHFMNRNKEIYLFPNNILSLWADMVLEFYCPMVAIPHLTWFLWQEKNHVSWAKIMLCKSFIKNIHIHSIYVQAKKSQKNSCCWKSC